MSEYFYCYKCMSDVHMRNYGGGKKPLELCKVHKDIADKSAQKSKEKEMKDNRLTIPVKSQDKAWVKRKLDLKKSVMEIGHLNNVNDHLESYLEKL